MDSAHHRFLGQPVLPRHSETRAVPSLGAHALLRSKDCRGPRGHSHPRCGGVRSRLRSDWDVSGERDVPAYGALNVRVSKARPGENPSDGIAFRTCRALCAQQTMVDDAFKQKLEWPIIASIAQPGDHLSIGTGLDGGIPCTR